MPRTPHSILVPTDLSATADRAVELALGLARRFDAAIHLLHVRELLEQPLLPDQEQAEVERLLASADRSGEETLSREAEDLGPAPVTPHLVRGVSAAEAIVQSGADLGCDLIVIGTHGRRGIKSLLLGSVAEAVVRTASTPVLTVHLESHVDLQPVPRILLAHDFSREALETLDLASTWARALEAEIVLLHIVEPVVYPEFYGVDILPDEMLPRLRERSLKALEELAATHLDRVNTTPRVVVGKPGEAIIREAEENGADLIVMGKRGLNVFEQLLLGSIADKVLRRSRVPVLTVRSHG